MPSNSAVFFTAFAAEIGDGFSTKVTFLTSAQTMFDASRLSSREMLAQSFMLQYDSHIKRDNAGLHVISNTSYENGSTCRSFRDNSNFEDVPEGTHSKAGISLMHIFKAMRARAQRKACLLHFQ